MSRLQGIHPNLSKFLDLIGYSEGTVAIPNSDDGYQVIVGSTRQHPILFHDYSDHPRHKIWLPDLKLYSSAAGKFQITAPNFDAYKPILHLKDFGPRSQELIGIRMITECHAMPSIVVGEIEEAISLCAKGKRWASFPGANCNQHEHKMSVLMSVWRTLLGNE